MYIGVNYKPRNKEQRNKDWEHSFLFCRLKKELTLLNNWENLVLVAKEDYGSTPLTESIQDILDFKDLAIEDFQELYNAADAFNKWILKRN